MSLDIWLTIKSNKNQKEGSFIGGRIFIREDGTTKEISREEWDSRFPSREPVVFVEPHDSSDDDYVFVYENNITHNLGKMADEAGLYECLWHPERLGIIKARELIEPLIAGLFILQNDRARFVVFNPLNGWGDYEDLVAFVKEYLTACIKYPDAYVSISR